MNLIHLILGYEVKELTTSTLPRGWANVEIADLAAKGRYALAIGPFGSNLKVCDYRESGVPLVFVREIRREAFGGVKTKFIEVGKAKSLAAHAITGGDLLITKMGTPPGDTAIYPIGLTDAVITADCIKLTVNEASSPEFLRFWLRTHQIKAIIQARTQGVAQQKLSLERFRTITLPLPPLAEQCRIVTKLDELFSELDAGVEVLKHAQLRLARYRQSVFNAAVTGELTRIWRDITQPQVPSLHRHSCLEMPVQVPSTWAWVAFDKVAKISGGLTKNQRRAAMQFQLPYLRVANVYADNLQLDDIEEIGITEGELSRVQLHAGDLLIVEGNGSQDQIGRVAVWDGSISPCLHQLDSDEFPLPVMPPIRRGLGPRRATGTP